MRQYKIIVGCSNLKESIYNTMRPIICQYVGFQEVEVTLISDGTAQVNYMLQSNAHTTFQETSVHWQHILDNNFFLTSTKVTSSSVCCSSLWSTEVLPTETGKCIKIYHNYLFLWNCYHFSIPFPAGWHVTWRYTWVVLCEIVPVHNYLRAATYMHKS